MDGGAGDDNGCCCGWIGTIVAWTWVLITSLDSDMVVVVIVDGGDGNGVDLVVFARDFPFDLVVLRGASISWLISSPRSSAATTALERNLPAWSRGERYASTRLVNSIVASLGRLGGYVMIMRVVRLMMDEMW